MCARPEINGKDAGWFIVDTGSTSTCIDSELAASLRLQTVWRNKVRSPGGPIPLDYVKYDELRLGPVVLKDGIAVERHDFAHDEFVRRV